ELAGPADRLRLLPGFLLGWFLVMAAQLHFAEDALSLHLFLERLEGLVDVIVPDENLHAAYLFEWILIDRLLGQDDAPAAHRFWCARLAEAPAKVHWRPAKSLHGPGTQAQATP